MSGRELTVFHQLLDGGRELKQSERIGNGDSAPPHPLRHFLMSERQLFHHLFKAGCLLECVKILALQVLHQHLDQRGVIVGSAHDRRDRHQPGPAGCPPAPLAGHQFVLISTSGAQQNWLQYAELTNGLSQGFQTFVIKVIAWLIVIWSNLGQRYIDQPRTSHRWCSLSDHRHFTSCARNQGAQSFT